MSVLVSMYEIYVLRQTDRETDRQTDRDSGADIELEVLLAHPWPSETVKAASRGVAAMKRKTKTRKSKILSCCKRGPADWSFVSFSNILAVGANKQLDI